MLSGREANTELPFVVVFTSFFLLSAFALLIADAMRCDMRPRKLENGRWNAANAGQKYKKRTSGYVCADLTVTSDSFDRSTLIDSFDLLVRKTTNFLGLLFWPSFWVESNESSNELIFCACRVSQKAKESWH